MTEEMECRYTKSLREEVSGFGEALASQEQKGTTQTNIKKVERKKLKGRQPEADLEEIGGIRGGGAEAR